MDPEPGQDDATQEHGQRPDDDETAGDADDGGAGSPGRPPAGRFLDGYVPI